LRVDQVKRWIKGKERASSKFRSRPVNPETGNVLGFPSAASVLTVSAPNMLLSSSLNSFLVGLGVYLGFTWTRNLDEVTGTKGSRAVFIFYVVGLAVCYGVYAASGTMVANQNDLDLWDVLIKTVHVAAVTHVEDSGGEKESTGDNSNPVQASTNADPERSAASQQLLGSSRRQDGPNRQELLQVFREAAELRKASTELDEQLARILERLG
jgi:hypothetical protein